jgi:hypothetical protein
MPSYTVHIPMTGPDPLQRARFVADTFSKSALVAGPLWLFAQGAWISGLMAVAVDAAFLLLATALRLPPEAVLGGLALIHLLIALEGATLLRWELALKGWREAGLVAGDDLEALEQRFFAGETTGEPARVAPLPDQAPPVRPIFGAPGVIGLFPGGPASKTGPHS